MTKSLVLNAGSSSIKFQVFENEDSVLSGLCDAIGLENSKVKMFVIPTNEELQIIRNSIEVEKRN